MKDYFKILEIEPTNSINEIKDAYRRLAKKYHPDLNKSPQAPGLFIEITEAYEVLCYRLSKGNAESATYQEEYDDFIRKVREAAQKRARMKYEKFKKEHEAFQESGLYDIVLLLKYIGLIFLPVLATALILFPIVIAITTGDIFAFFYLFYFWVIGLFLFYYILQQGKNYFKREKFYYSYKKVLSKFTQNVDNSGRNCFFCNRLPANSLPYKIELFKVKGIKLENRGPLQHYAGIARTSQELSLPRSRKALMVHTFVSLTKCCALLLSFFLIPIDSYIWRLIFGFFIAWFCGSLMLWLTSTKSKVGYFFSMATIFKIAFWLIPIILISTFNFYPFNIVTNDLTKMLIVILAFTDSFLEQALKAPKHINLYRPFLKSYRILDSYYAQKYCLYLEIPVWTAIFPVLRWLV